MLTHKLFMPKSCGKLLMKKVLDIKVVWYISS